MLPRLPLHDPSSVAAASRAFKPSPRTTSRRREPSPRLEERPDDDDAHVSYIPREYYVVETHAVPTYNPQQFASSFKVGPNGHGIWETIVFPSLEPHTRQEVLYLQQALHAMQANAATEASSSAPSQVAAEWRIYAVVFHELIRQMKFICKEQATIVTYLVSQMQSLFVRLHDHVKILEAASLLVPPTTVQVLTPAPPPTPKPPASGHRPCPSKPEEEDDDDADEEGFVCSLCLEYSKDPAREATRRSTLLSSITMRHLGTSINGDNRKLQAIRKLQAVFRGYRIRRDKWIVDRVRRRQHAARTIQRAFQRFEQRKRAIAKKRAQDTWRKHVTMILAVRRLQKRVRKFLQVGREYREGQLSLVANRFKLAGRDLSQVLDEKCTQLETISRRLQNFQIQIQHMVALIVPGTRPAPATTLRLSQEVSEVDPVDCCGDVHLALVELHHHVSELHVREQRVQRESEATLCKLREAQRAWDEAKRANVGFGKDDDDEDTIDGWAIGAPRTSSSPARPTSVVRTAAPDVPEPEPHGNKSLTQELYATMKPLRYGKKWLAHTNLKREPTVESPVATIETSALHDDVVVVATERSGSLASTGHSVTTEGHRGAVLMHRFRSTQSLERPRRPLGWVKQLLVHIYETIALALREERQSWPPHVATALVHQFDLSLTLPEAQAVASAMRDLRSAKPATSLSDIICRHFQAHFGLPQLVDQAIYDLATHIHEYAQRDPDVHLFQHFLNGTRSRANLAFFSYVRQLCAALSRDDASSSPRLPYLHATSSRELIDVPHALKVAQILLRVRDETILLEADPLVDLNGRTPSALFEQCRAAIEAKAQEAVRETHEFDQDGNDNDDESIEKPRHAFNALLQPLKFHSHLPASRSPVRSRVQTTHPPSLSPVLYFADFFDILCKFHAEVHVHATQREWLQETFDTIDGDRRAPTPRELHQIYRHALQVPLDRTKVPTARVGPMGFRTFFGIVQRLLATKQLRPSALHAEADDDDPDPTIAHDKMKLQTIMHRLTLDWLEKEPFVEAALAHDAGRHLGPRLRQLCVELTQALCLKPSTDAIETRIEQMQAAWERYCAIICVVMVLEIKRAGGVSVVEAQLGDVDRVWNVCFRKPATDVPTVTTV
ncbi:hypothetical protein SPRG_10999 [Saprolegnia parasitica CBS 223.65]|uniref:Uncharacterized protein n=1 Tax=Saprolegnia parasitica (strain CBS 223.65) TaxID=695850 RepID=A0A067C0T6_SAPPC|nr:hypothetical protein SPRG_10999 [Saprolegnia parasitica CBS 223.65]KDO22685.1 hypothetical protein SPRG_10999 [Saprolegnia parasitica CBS 223.65]|eukprot:XP_012206600.1 hypothetical protein SPRG_10999 [Saprolegnia parasitica CBS 223.65]